MRSTTVLNRDWLRPIHRFFVLPIFAFQPEIRESADLLIREHSLEALSVRFRLINRAFSESERSDHRPIKIV
jgi:hypothetical protein